LLRNGLPLRLATSRSEQDLLPGKGRGQARGAEALREVDTLIAAAKPTGGKMAADARVLGRYRLLERLGSGGFGEVWRAEDELLRREVAVKRIPLAADDVAPRAAREAHAAARLSHPAIVALYEAAEQDGHFYLTSELVHGATLARLIADDALCDEEIAEIGLALCDALGHAHDRGVIHRDVKPQNILVPDEPCDRSGVAKLTDFGGARLDGEQALTQAGDVLGTLAYMAPEQSEGLQAGPEADLYSLALVLYEALSGENPVRAVTPAATVRRIGSDLPALRRMRRDLPRELTAAIDRALSPQPQQRGTLHDLAAALVLALRDGGEGQVASREGLAAGPSIEPGPLEPRDCPDPVGCAPTAIGPFGVSSGNAATTAEEWRRSPAEPARGLQGMRERSSQHESVPAHLLEPAQRSARLQTLPCLPRLLWVALTFALLVWQTASGRTGLALLLLAAALPLMLAMPQSASPGWLAPALAPLLGLAGLAAAYPVAAGQPARARTRACLGALGYWWLCLGEIAAREGMAPAIAYATGFPGAYPGAHASGAWAPAGWTTSLGAASGALGHLLHPAMLCGAALWAAGALVLPWIVRGADLAIDLLFAGAWSAAMLVGPPLLASSLQPSLSMASAPAAAIFAAVLGALLAAALAQGGRTVRSLRA
jgi:eukaryotic-like serine/threonine-protein kinase